jgi:hypothetical protein
LTIAEIRRLDADTILTEFGTDSGRITADEAQRRCPNSDPTMSTGWTIPCPDREASR